MGDAEVQTYSITRGGPLRRAEQLLRITRGGQRDLVRRAGVVVALAYVPVLAAAIGWRAAAGHWPPALGELTIHVRALVVLPLLLLAEEVIEDRAGAAGLYLFRSELLGPECLAGHRSTISRTARLRDSIAVEAALLTAALVSSLVMPAWTARQTEPAVRWSMQPGMLLYRFLLLRLLWRWCMWALYLRRLSRLPLTLRATHPDRVAGLEPLAGPSGAFALLVTAGASSIAASWGDRMRFEGVPATAFSSVAITYAGVALVLAAAPLSVFTRRLIQARKAGLHAYGALANRYSDAFERRWYDRSGEEALGAQDFQALNDLGGSFERVQQMRAMVAPRMMVTLVVAGAVLPLLPLVMAEIGLAALLERLAKAFL
ncbi:MAG: hypothetical protein IT372_02750 [Polyangiaceae bacterium]|nr:hypothetical protein [Polyangiaceae bacterium]